MDEAWIKQFADNKPMAEAIRAFFLSLKWKQLSQIDTRQMTNENVGQLYRGIDEGHRWVEGAFRELAQRWALAAT